MSYNLLDYLSWLRALELQQIELREVILTYEGHIQTLRRLVWLTRQVDPEDDQIGVWLMEEIQASNLLEQYRDELAEVELDISHCRFMIDRLSYQ